MRKLKFAEKKLLKHLDLYNWKVGTSVQQNSVMRSFHIQKREHYVFYSKLAFQVREISRKIKELDPKDPARIEMGGQLIEKLYSLGVIPTKWNLKLCDDVMASSFCRRRLSSIMVKSKMAPDMKTAVTFIEQGHVRVGVDLVKDPAFLVTRAMEDFVTWVDTSKIKKQILQYNEERDDFLLENC